MSRIVAIGHEAKLAGYAIVGVEIIDATDPDLVRQAWRQIERDVGLVLLTADARRALPDPIDRADVLWAVLPA